MFAQRLIGALAVVSVCGAVLGAALQAPFTPPTTPFRLRAFAVNMSTVATGANSSVDIQIDRWSTTAEREKLKAVFLEKGPQRLLDALQDTRRVGFIRLPATVGHDLRYAQADPMEDGGQRIVIVTDRPISFQEASNRPRSFDYPFTLIQIHLDKQGQGEGRMSVATMITHNPKTNSVVLENYGSEPVRLNSVRVQ